MRDKRAASTRAAILESARRLFAEHGYAHTTLAQLAADAEVSVQTIYNSVGGKQAVLLGVVEVVDEIARVGHVMRDIKETEDPLEIVRFTVAMRQRAIEGAGDILHGFIAAAAAEPEIAAESAARARRTRERCRQIAIRLQTLDALRPELDVDEASDVLFTLLHHAVWHRLANECQWETARIEEWLVSVLRDALLR